MRIKKQLRKIEVAILGEETKRILFAFTEASSELPRVINKIDSKSADKLLKLYSKIDLELREIIYEADKRVKQSSSAAP